MSNTFKPGDLVRFQGEDRVYLVESIQIPPVNCVLRGRKGYPARIGALEHAVVPGNWISIRRGNKVRASDGIVRTVMDVVDCKVRCEQWHDVVDVTLVADDEGEGEAPSEAGAMAFTREAVGSGVIAIGSGAISVPAGSTAEAELRKLWREARDRAEIQKDRADLAEALRGEEAEKAARERISFQADIDKLREINKRAEAEHRKEEGRFDEICRAKTKDYLDQIEANVKLRSKCRCVTALLAFLVLWSIFCICLAATAKDRPHGLPAGAWRWY